MQDLPLPNLLLLTFHSLTVYHREVKQNHREVKQNHRKVKQAGWLPIVQIQLELQVKEVSSGRNLILEEAEMW